MLCLDCFKSFCPFDMFMLYPDPQTLYIYSLCIGFRSRLGYDCAYQGVIN
jgi:hypothetical protein